MARRNQNLAGLAALGALGYALSRGKELPPVEDRVGTPVERDIAPAPEPVDYGPDYDRELARAGRGPVGIGAVSAPSRLKAMPSDTGDETARLARRYPAPRSSSVPMSSDTGDETARLARRYPAPAAKPRMRTREELIAAIPNEFAGRDRTGIVDNPVTGNAFTRNLSNTLNATAGLSAPGFVGRETAKQFGARAAARRAEEGLSDAEVADLMRRRALTEADTTGGAMGYKKGGRTKAKKMVVTKTGGRGSSASKRADGIATKGKTRGKLY